MTQKDVNHVGVGIVQKFSNKTMMITMNLHFAVEFFEAALETRPRENTVTSCFATIIFPLKEYAYFNVVNSLRN